MCVCASACRTRFCTHTCADDATSCVRTYVRTCCGIVYDSLQFIVWTSICQVSGRGRYRRFRRIFGVENCQLSQWNSIRIVHQRLCRPRARTLARPRAQACTHSRTQRCSNTRVKSFGKPTPRTLPVFFAEATSINRDFYDKSSLPSHGTTAVANLNRNRGVTGCWVTVDGRGVVARRARG